MKRLGGRAALGAVLLSAAFLTHGCGSGGGAAFSGGGSARTASLTGRLSAPGGESLAGTRVVAEQVIGGRTSTVRAIADASDAIQRESLIAASQESGVTGVPGVYTTTAMPDGSFSFRN